MIKSLLLTTFILVSFISFLQNMSSVVEATRLPGGTDNWYANSLRILERPASSPPPYPKPAPPERDGVVASSFNNNMYEMRPEESDYNLERPKHPPPSYPKPAPPERYVASSHDQLSVLASTYSYTSTI